jgi:type II secretory pathway component PulM
MDDTEDVEQLQAEGELDAHAAEALRLQIRRLARQHGIELTELTVEREGDDQPSA